MESGKIGTFEQNLVVPAAQPEKVTLSGSVLLSSQLVPIEKSSEVATKGQGVRAKITSSPLDMEGQRIIPSVTNYFTQGQTLYVFLQAYYPEKADKNATFDPSSLRAGLVFLRNGIQMNATPLIAPAQVDAKTHTVSFRISLPLQKLPTGRYTVQVVAIGAWDAAFGVRPSLPGTATDSGGSYTQSLSARLSIGWRPACDQLVINVKALARLQLSRPSVWSSVGSCDIPRRRLIWRAYSPGHIDCVALRQFRINLVNGFFLRDLEEAAAGSFDNCCRTFLPSGRDS